MIGISSLSRQTIFRMKLSKTFRDNNSNGCLVEQRIIVHMGGEKCVLGTLLQLNNLPFKPLLTLSDIPLYNARHWDAIQANYDAKSWIYEMGGVFFASSCSLHHFKLSAVQGAGCRLVWVALDNVSSQYCFKYTNWTWCNVLVANWFLPPLNWSHTIHRFAIEDNIMIEAR